jgi:hypothetical protein
MHAQALAGRAAAAAVTDRSSPNGAPPPALKASADALLQALGGRAETEVDKLAGTEVRLNKKSLMQVCKA